MKLQRSHTNPSSFLTLSYSVLSLFGSFSYAGSCTNVSLYGRAALLLLWLLCCCVLLCAAVYCCVLLRVGRHAPEAAEQCKQWIDLVMALQV